MSEPVQRIIVIGGRIFDPHSRPQALYGPGDNSVARALVPLLQQQLQHEDLAGQYRVEAVRTQHADGSSSPATPDDVARQLDALVADPTVKALALVVAAGPHYEALLSRVRRERKDIFLVGCTHAEGMDSGTQYTQALELLKRASANLVLTVVPGGLHMIVAPEETRYCETYETQDVLAFLARMTVSRMRNHFTRSTVVPGEAVPWRSEQVPASLRAVVDHCVDKGAYKPVLGKTAGHFAVNIGDGKVLTSIRKSNFNQLDSVGLVRIEAEGDDRVVAHGFKPSVGGQSQRSIFRMHPQLDCIVHFHCPVLPEAQGSIPVAQQWPNECGSHECGLNTARGLREVDLGDGHRLSVVMLDSHGPNIVFNRDTPAHLVIDFINRHFDLRAKTGGLLAH